jgi:hypothetical protein
MHRKLRLGGRKPRVDGSIALRIKVFCWGLFSMETTAVSEATFVSFVPKAKTAKLRRTLQTEDTGAIKWREHKTLFGSEFYFSGPAALVRRTHEYVTYWLTTVR